MGRQVQFHVLAPDIEALMRFVQHRDPVLVVSRDSASPEVSALINPAAATNVLTLWNQELLPAIKRKHINGPGREYFTFDNSLPLIELSPSRACEWNGREALLAGRIYGLFDSDTPQLANWFDALARWIRKNFIKSTLPGISYVGQSAHDWYKNGGLLLPMMIPPAVTSVWLSWVEAQDQHRALFR